MQNFQDTFETRKRSFISAFSISMTLPLRNKNEEQLVNLCETKNLERQVILHSELPKTLFPIKSSNNMKIEIPRLRIIAMRWVDLGRSNITYEYLLSHSIKKI